MPWDDAARRVMFWAKCIRVLGRFVIDKEESSLELAMLVTVKPKPLIEGKEGNRTHVEPRGYEANSLLSLKRRAQPPRRKLPLE